MVYLVSFVLLLVLLACVLFSVLSLRMQYMVVLGWPRYGNFYFEVGEDGRYAQVRGTQVPLAVARFAVLSTAWAATTLSRRVRDWAHAHAPATLAAKI